MNDQSPTKLSEDEQAATDRATDAMIRGLEILNFDPDAILLRDPSMLLDRHFLGALHAEHGQPSEALAHFQRALSIQVTTTLTVFTTSLPDGAQNSAYSEDDRVKRFMVRENLREAGLPIDVYYDSPMFRKSGNCSPEMEYLCHGVNLGNRAFHGKVNMILAKDSDTGQESLLLGAGSNNLSRAGWWDNIECQHWEELSSGECSRKLVNILLEEIEFLKHQGKKPDQIV